MKRFLSVFLAMVLILGMGASVANAEETLTYKAEPYGVQLHLEEEEVDVENFAIAEVKGEEETLVAISYKLRDIAAVLKDTESKFNIGFDGEKGAVVITRGDDYLPLEQDLTKLDTENAKIFKSMHNVIVDGKEYTAEELGGHVIDGHNYYKMSTISNILNNFMFQSKGDDAYIFIGETDIEEFDQEAFEALRGEEDYTLVYIWGPWCYYSIQSMEGMVLGVNEYLEDNDDMQVVGIISRYNNYRQADVDEVYGSEDFSVKDFGATSEAFEYFGEIYDTEIQGVPFIMILDKEGNVVGKSNQDLSDQVQEDYLAENELTEEELEADDEHYTNYLTKLYTEFVERTLNTQE